jgi:nucleoside-diphosphate-sugar epimerase
MLESTAHLLLCLGMALERSALVIGGTGHIGPVIAARLMTDGWRVTLVNRGRTVPPPDVAHLPRVVADRDQPDALQRAIGDLRPDLVVDCTCFTATHARDAMAACAGRTGHYLTLSTGQVFLVGVNAPMPSADGDEHRPLMAAPTHPWHKEQFDYGAEKRDVERVIRTTSGLHTTILRLPMVHSPRDPYQRLHQYLWRALDGHGLLLPQLPDRELRHVGVHDIARAVAALAERPLPSASAVQLSPERSAPFAWFVEELARVAGRSVPLHRTDRDTLTAHNLLPRTSPFSTGWMSVLDGSVLATHLGWWPQPVDTLLRETLAAVAPAADEAPAHAAQRAQELALISALA